MTSLTFFVDLILINNLDCGSKLTHNFWKKNTLFVIGSFQVAWLTHLAVHLLIFVRFNVQIIMISYFHIHILTSIFSTTIKYNVNITN